VSASPEPDLQIPGRAPGSARGSHLFGNRAFLVSTASTLAFFVAVALAFFFAPGSAEVRATFFSVQDMKEAFVGVPAEGLPSVGKAFVLNVEMFLISEVLILVFALIVAVVRQIPGPAFFPFRLVATAYTDFFRGTPILLVIFLLGYGFPALNLPVVSTQPPIVYAIVALTLSYSAYVSEVYRAGIESVHLSQSDAARSLGLSRWQSLRFVILPQAIRRVIPPLLNDFVSLQKDTALISTLGVIEATRAAGIYASYRFNYSPYVMLAFMFILLTIPLARFTDHLIERDRRRRAAGGGA
jgi:polar amino acid transport system permease protein